MKRGIFYIIAPAGHASGGPELLHQLGRQLINRGLNVRMIYYPFEQPSPVHSNYIEYNIPVAQYIEDESSNVLIVPEIYTIILARYKSIKKIVWWLSVDNYYLHMSGWSGRFNRRILKYFNSQRYMFFDSSLRKVDLHLVQSEYAKKHLHKNGINKCIGLSDYLHESFIREAERVDLREKKNIVLYNPKKGFAFTRKLISNCPEIDFIPLINLSREEVVQLLKKAKLYIDFGYHPGKDRIPREAALMNCCVITNRLGSANNAVDIPILNAYKISNNQRDIIKIKNIILGIFNEYEMHNQRFEDYRDIIKNQEVEFNYQVDSLLNYLK